MFGRGASPAGLPSAESNDKQSPANAQSQEKPIGRLVERMNLPAFRLVVIQGGSERDA
jgi:hypothetical protein